MIEFVLLFEFFYICSVEHQREIRARSRKRASRMSFNLAPREQ